MIDFLILPKIRLRSYMSNKEKIRLFARYAKSPLIFTYIVHSVSVFGLRPDVFPARYSVRPKVKNIPSVIHCKGGRHSLSDPSFRPYSRLKLDLRVAPSLIFSEKKISEVSSNHWWFEGVLTKGNSFMTN